MKTISKANALMVLAMIAVLAFGCKKTEEDNNGNGNDPTLSLNPTETTIYFVAAGEDYPFIVTTNQESWSVKLEPADSWMSYEKTGEKTFTLTADPTTSTTAPPDVKVTVSAGMATPIVITAKQRAYVEGPYLWLRPDTKAIEFDAPATKIFIFEVDTNQSSWTAVSDKDWVEVDTDTANGKFTVTAKPNTATTTPEAATITVTAGDATPITISITQEAAPVPSLEMTPAAADIEFDAPATKSFTFEVTTNQGLWTAEADKDWVEIDVDTESNEFTVTAKPNKITSAPAAATITVSAGNATPITFKATQEAAPMPSLGLTPAAAAIEFDAAATKSFVYEVATNQDTWTAIADQDWVKITIDAVNNKFTVTAKPNTVSSSPTAAIITVTSGEATPIAFAATQEAAVEANLALSPSAADIAFTAEATENFVFEVFTNQLSWTAEADQDWVKIDLDEANNKFTVSANSNMASPAPAAATITVSAGTATNITFGVTQAADDSIINTNLLGVAHTVLTHGTMFSSGFGTNERSAITFLSERSGSGQPNWNYWGTILKAEPDTEFAILKINQLQSVNMMYMWPRNGYAAEFPVSFKLYATMEDLGIIKPTETVNTRYPDPYDGWGEPILVVENCVPGSDEFPYVSPLLPGNNHAGMHFGFPATKGLYFKLEITAEPLVGGKYTSSIAEMDLLLVVD